MELERSLPCSCTIPNKPTFQSPVVTVCTTGFNNNSAHRMNVGANSDFFLEHINQIFVMEKYCVFFAVGAEL